MKHIDLIKSEIDRNGHCLIGSGIDGMAVLLCPTTLGLRVIASWGMGWEHVSVSLEHRCPNWDEMSIVKDFFWNEDEVAFQFHPKKKDYINCHPYCLHLWKPIGKNIKTPPTELIGV